MVTDLDLDDIRQEPEAITATDIHSFTQSVPSPT